MAFIIRLIIVVVLAATMASVHSKLISSISLLSSPAYKKIATRLCETAWAHYQNATSPIRITGDCKNIDEATRLITVDGRDVSSKYFLVFRGKEFGSFPVQIRMSYHEEFVHEDGKDLIAKDRWVDEVIVTRDREL
ncbi:hypothetical protein AXF42_Ash016318 [Apostasia shenzhenica]|uniref:Uncharacterized protein n=1 Tax=Apostasia shenzhenica TaxID=1088818 RepID=A0A2H9ZXD6_9ASPA|nr:hypothetical protein AXF42_Ash016318 [Apostasia shenzhenica]